MRTFRSKKMKQRTEKIKTDFTSINDRHTPLGPPIKSMTVTNYVISLTILLLSYPKQDHRRWHSYMRWHQLQLQVLLHVHAETDSSRCVGVLVVQGRVNCTVTGHGVDVVMIWSSGYGKCIIDFVQQKISIFM